MERETGCTAHTPCPEVWTSCYTHCTQDVLYIHHVSRCGHRVTHTVRRMYCTYTMYQGVDIVLHTLYVGWSVLHTLYVGWSVPRSSSVWPLPTTLYSDWAHLRTPLRLCLASHDRPCLLVHHYGLVGDLLRCWLSLRF